jgi:hypothetical protein
VGSPPRTSRAPRNEPFSGVFWDELSEEKQAIESPPHHESCAVAMACTFLLCRSPSQGLARTAAICAHIYLAAPTGRGAVVVAGGGGGARLDRAVLGCDWRCAAVLDAALKVPTACGECPPALVSPSSRAVVCAFSRSYTPFPKAPDTRACDHSCTIVPYPDLIQWGWPCSVQVHTLGYDEQSWDQCAPPSSSQVARGYRVELPVAEASDRRLSTVLSG